MGKYDWKRLNHLQLGKYAEYFVKMKFTMCGFDVYTSEVDCLGIDFVVRKAPNLYYDVQVKSVRDLNYIFFRKEYFAIRDNLFAAIVLFDQNEVPDIYLLRATLWKSPNDMFVDHEYQGKKTPPEWGLNLSKKSLSVLTQHAFESVAATL